MHDQPFAFGPAITQKPAGASDKPSALALADAEDAVARLDERLATSPIADAFSTRANFHDAAAALFLEGELIHLEDLVLHDAAADIRAPTHALIRAHAALRARRRVAAAAPGWAASPSGLEMLRGAPPSHDREATPDIPRDPIAVEEDAFAAELAAMDALLARTRRVLDGTPGAATPLAPKTVSPVRADRLTEWRARWSAAETPVLAAARAGAALDELAPLPNQAWLGRLVVADLLRANGKTRHHLAALSLGMKLARHERPRDAADRTALWIAAITLAAEAGLRDHDRLLNAYRGLARKLVGRRRNSKLPQLVELIMRSPLVSTQTIAADLKVTPRAAQDLVAALDLREMTGRTRYRCWGVL